ncbi:uncharacterized protein [Lepeophtheirus salmonis]|uniref:uncharacterized protein n=1 Tax=Lepeophtheirus salmonis TaxID=72036 RepID=UPI001AE58627|nr:protein draper-like [Lepeophtheirus salmonis]
MRREEKKVVHILFNIFMSILFFGLVLGGNEETDEVLVGPNVCLMFTEDTVSLNTSYHVVETKHNSYFCFKSITFRCSYSEDVMKTKYKMKNVTRTKSTRICCEGYELVDKQCIPSCKDNPCLKGICTEPGVCTCEAGYSGLDCSEVGCPDPFTWGMDCSRVCDCERDLSSCNPKDGTCHCYPGYGGTTCNTLCPPNTYGQNCSKTCNCAHGSRCHHVTGNCVPCDPGYYGEHCKLPCACESEGTLICHPGTGFCACQPGYYGLRCQDHCPFGMKKGKCFKEPIPGEICACRDEIAMTCDPVKGCVCQLEGACDMYTLPSFASNSQSVAKNNVQNTGAESASSSTIAVSVILVLVCMIVLCAALYYRRRFRRAQKDLDTRAALYFKPENSISNNYECILTKRNNIANNVREKNHTSKQQDLSSEPLPSTSNYHENTYEEIGSPTKIKNNEQLAAYYKKDSKLPVDTILNDPLRYVMLNEPSPEKEEDSDEKSKNKK